MMKLRSLRNSRGLTLVELIVAMAMSTVLLATMVSASLFVQRYVSNWQRQDKLTEEISAISREIGRPLASARQVSLFRDSLRLVALDMTRMSFDWHSGNLLRNGHNLTRSGLHIDSLSVTRSPLPKSPVETTLPGTNQAPGNGLYALFIQVSSRAGLVDSLRMVVRNEFEYQKFTEK